MSVNNSRGTRGDGLPDWSLLLLDDRWSRLIRSSHRESASQFVHSSKTAPHRELAGQQHIRGTYRNSTGRKTRAAFTYYVFSKLGNYYNKLKIQEKENIVASCLLHDAAEVDDRLHQVPNKPLFPLCDSWGLSWFYREKRPGGVGQSSRTKL